MNLTEDLNNFPHSDGDDINIRMNPIFVYTDVMKENSLINIPRLQTIN